MNRGVLAASRTFVRQSEADMNYGGEHSKCEKNIEETSVYIEEYVYDRRKHGGDQQPRGKPGSVSIDDYKYGVWIALHCLMRPNT